MLSHYALNLLGGRDYSQDEIFLFLDSILPCSHAFPAGGFGVGFEITEVAGNHLAEEICPGVGDGELSFEGELLWEKIFGEFLVGDDDRSFEV